ncbi:aconitate hydratase AcnA [Arsenicicoccus piscis]|uniref:Aconitate hydratase n=1 Tax=Arsenicicoccus piscis TaxID=673954 RepID=A0ABQ6HPD3_9MICO|nr:aconitate hydratase AcnA [Arsenicicoccus piscis]MCH8628426.1 aconitate hydratase AcnA [Arsenicicoccus piscis]GMA20017.1 aconitate hydratase [Arsenicicoccus piscis]
MTTASGARAATSLTHVGRTYRMIDLPATLASDLDRLPFALRLLAENVARHGSPTQLTALQAALTRWLAEGTSVAELEVVPGRLLMHDTTSTPALVDLAAMRDTLAEAGYDPGLLSPTLPVDVSVDHSLAVESYANPDAATANLRLELRRNAERYRFLKWAATAMHTVRLNPPGTGIMHTINLEQLATVVSVVTASDGESDWLTPDVMLGTDSHTPMINGLGVLGWGIGGLEAEMVMLGLPCTLRLPDVVGVRLTGRLRDGISATDLALTLTHQLRRLGVSGDFVEFFGPGAGSLTVGQRAVVANMAPEYGATTGYFPVDAQVCDYLALVARDRVDPGLVEAYCRASSLWLEPDSAPTYSRVLDLDLTSIELSIAGPARPQDLLTPAAVPASLPAGEPAAPSTLAQPAAGASDIDGLPAFPVALAAITSCTNTSDPRLIVTAGLLARRARALGLTAAPWVKTSLAPGSPAAAAYLARSGLDTDLSAVGFDVVGFGCTTCIGNSGPLPPRVDAARRAGTVTPVAVLSGNRNFSGRVHPDLRTGYLMTPALVVAYALGGDAARDLASEPVAHTPDGRSVMLDELWPSTSEVDAVLATAVRAQDFPEAFARAHANPLWAALESPSAARFPWSETSTILRRPPFAGAGQGTLLGTFDASPLLVLGDDVTTDHISPASAIPADSPVADFLVERGEDRADLNVFASRRGNWEVMTRGAFYAASLVNELAPNAPVGTTMVAGGDLMTIFDAANHYAAQDRPTVVIAGERYGMGSSRDWAAKAQRLLGVRAVLAASFERIHRTNLIGMGILPLLLPPQARAALGEIHADDLVQVDAEPGSISPRCPVSVVLKRPDGSRTELTLTAAIETSAEVDLLREGGAIPAILSTVTSRNDQDAAEGNHP